MASHRKHSYGRSSSQDSLDTDQIFSGGATRYGEEEIYFVLSFSRDASSP